MRRSPLHIALIAVSLCLLLAAFGSLAALGAPLAHAQIQIRPTLTPTAIRTPAKHHTTNQQPAATGRIAGTVIDLTSGAPAPGVMVMVDSETLITDANGNYERMGLRAGSYRVALVLRAEQGISAQETITVALDAGATVIQHLAFRSPPQPAAVVLGSAHATPIAPLPATLPPTGATEGVIWPLALIALAFLLSGICLTSQHAPSLEHPENR